jgi:hypothetical protein
VSSEAASHREQRKHQPYDKNQRGEKGKRTDNKHLTEGEEEKMDVDFLDVEKGECLVTLTTDCY